MKSYSKYAAAAAAFSISASAMPLSKRDNGTMISSWDELTPSASLDWKPCFDLFQCTLLEVPLDYEDPSIGTTGVAFIKYASNNTDAEDILVNPGGPGGSGVDFLMDGYEDLAARFGSQYNWVGFDPRGIKNSGPDVSCFPGGPEYDIYRNIVSQDVYRPLDGSEDREDLQATFDKVGEFGRWCTDVYAVNGTAQYANTVAVVNDMRYYIEKKAESLGQAPEEAKLWFYGISYGSVLGATYATLFPDRIERMIIDGVVDTEDYYLSGWKTSLVDADAAMEDFYKTCFEAGPEACAFAGNSTSPDGLRDRFMAIYNRLKESPVQYSNATLGVPPVSIEWQDLMTLVIGQLYSLVGKGPYLASTLAEMEAGNFTTMGAGDLELSPLPPASSAYDLREARTAVTCFDMAGRFNLSTPEELHEYVAHQNSVSFYGGPLFANLIGPTCREWHALPPASQVFEGKPGAESLSAPMMVVGNTLDPVTPLVSAKKVADAFPGSGLLTVNGTGHAAYGFKSECFVKYMRAYLEGKTVPEQGAFCETDVKPFEVVEAES